jgi:hypothetical protein
MGKRRGGFESGLVNVITRIFRAGVLAVLLALGSLPAADTRPAVSAEYQVKAAFLFNFAQFAEWPATAFPKTDAPIVIGVLGENPFGTYLDALVRGEKIDGRALVVRQCRDLAEAKGCQLLFVSRSEGRRLEEIVEKLKGRSVLTVSDVDAFATAGGMVQFVMESGKVRLRINVAAANAAGVKISSKLLRPATIVTTGKD